MRESIERDRQRRHARLRLLTYSPPGGHPGIGYGEYHAGRGTEQQRVRYADQQTGYHDCRIALNLARGVPIEQIDPSLGHARSITED